MFFIQTNQIWLHFTTNITLKKINYMRKSFISYTDNGLHIIYFPWMEITSKYISIHVVFIIVLIMLVVFIQTTKIWPHFTTYITLASAKSKRLFYTKNTLPRVVIFSFFKICSISWKQFFFLVDFEKSKFATFSPIRGSSVLGKPMEPWYMTACSV